MKKSIHTFNKGISTKWNENSLVQVLNSNFCTKIQDEKKKEAWLRMEFSWF